MWVVCYSAWGQCDFETNKELMLAAGWPADAVRYDWDCALEPRLGVSPSSTPSDTKLEFVTCVLFDSSTKHS